VNFDCFGLWNRSHSLDSIARSLICVRAGDVTELKCVIGREKREANGGEMEKIGNNLKRALVLCIAHNDDDDDAVPLWSRTRLSE
jgi:hypothetical protein